MHEASIAISLVETVTGICRKQGYQSIERVRLKVGRAAGILPDALLFAFDVVKAGTAADNAELHIEYIPLNGKCSDCGSQFQSEERYIYACPACRSAAIKITGGNEMQIVDMEVN
jgi:hydrogenase nickel incorporation protein HypA/HybF